MTNEVNGKCKPEIKTKVEEKKGNMQNKLITMKMLATETNDTYWENLKTKKRKRGDHLELLTLTSPKAKQKLEMKMREQLDNETGELEIED